MWEQMLEYFRNNPIYFYIAVALVAAILLVIIIAIAVGVKRSKKRKAAARRHRQQFSPRKRQPPHRFKRLIPLSNNRLPHPYLNRPKMQKSAKKRLNPSSTALLPLKKNPAN